MKFGALCCGVVLSVSVSVTAGADEPVSSDPVADIVTSALADDFAWDWLSTLCDVYGPRLTGSAAYDRAAAWAVSSLREAGFDRVWTEPVMVPHWVRGAEWARLTAPVDEPLQVIGLGGSVGTPSEGLEAEVVLVHDFDELEALGDRVHGKIVLFNPEWSGYGSVAKYRVNGPAAASREGAAGALVRSATGVSLGTLHTGLTTFEDGDTRIPAAAVTTETADRIERLIERGETVRVRWHSEAVNHPLVEQPTVLAEVRGTDLPDEVVVAGCHFDSWDVGTGAHDDGAGCAVVVGSARLLLDERWRPKRTIRVVLFASEEQGGHAGPAYLEMHREELDRHVAAFESDSGCFAPAGFSVRGSAGAVGRVAELAAPLARLGASTVSVGWAGVDIGPIVAEGVPGIGHRTHNDRYFDYHHSPADTLDKVDPEHVAANVAAVAGLLWGVANADEPLPRSNR
jgi:carboxypeptidase Q